MSFIYNYLFSGLFLLRKSLKQLGDSIVSGTGVGGVCALAMGVACGRRGEGAGGGWGGWVGCLFVCVIFCFF